MRKPPLKNIIDAIQKTGGNVSAAAQALGTSRTSLHKWLRENKQLQEAREQAEESLLDMAESKLYTAIKNGELTAIIYTLKTKGRGRGWGEHQQIAFDKDDEINIGYKDADEN